MKQLTIIIFRCPIGQNRWHYCPEAALSLLRMDDSNGFDTMEQAHAAAANDPTIPAKATLKLESGAVLYKYDNPNEHVFVPVKAQSGCSRCGYARDQHPTTTALREQQKAAD